MFHYEMLQHVHYVNRKIVIIIVVGLSRETHKSESLLRYNGHCPPPSIN